MTRPSDKKVIPIRYKLMIIFVVVTVVMTALISTLILLNWRGTAVAGAEEKAAELNRDISRKIEDFLQVPYHINEANSRLIENGIVDLTDQEERERFFVSILAAHENAIYSFSFGSKEGEYYGARRNEEGVVQIMRNNALTGGESWYYHVTEDQTAGALAVRTGAFDPRTRDWYKAAELAQKPVYSPIYKHFVMPDLTLSAVWPIYDSSGTFQGVLGTHVILSSISKELKDLVEELGGYAAVIERDTGYLIANSVGRPNFRVRGGEFSRLSLPDSDSIILKEAYKHYQDTGENNFRQTIGMDSYYVQFTDYIDEGLDWVVVTAIPQAPLMAEIIDSIRNVTAVIILLVLAYILIYLQMSRKLISPMDDLIRSTGRIAAGDIHHRAPVLRNDELGTISRSFNAMADTLEEMVGSLENAVHSRTAELAESKEQLQLILDSTAEGIYGIDRNGICTFCNARAVEMLGYETPEDVLGKNTHMLIHHSDRNGTLKEESSSKIYQDMKVGETVRSSDEVFWRADGTFFDVEYYASPQYKAGAYIGAVVTFMDITERKEKEARIEYLSCHDSLTGLQNRRCMEDNMKNLDRPENLPLSVIFADVNGLKITNDIFGHAAGDELLRISADVLTSAARERDVVARIGGDEYVIVMPNTDRRDADRVKKDIIRRISKRKIHAIKCSMAVGSETKTDSAVTIEELVNSAENEMYKHKVQSKRESGIDSVETILASLHEASPRERLHSENVKSLSEAIGRELKLDAPELKKLGEAAYLHDIGKIAFSEDLLKEEDLDNEQKMRIQEHSIVGFRVLNLFDDTLDLAEMVYSHHENWDGTGYPKGLKGEEIPMGARIIRVAETFDAKTNPNIGDSVDRDTATELIQELAGSRFDPAVVEAFARVMRRNEEIAWEMKND
ncbi:MAG TPA: diguanylate cyclase [Bacillota bacterium]|nr:diguanylate cyclase [Bacillota bacterium]